MSLKELTFIDWFLISVTVTSLASAMLLVVLGVWMFSRM